MLDLTANETGILRMVAQGLTTSQIASRKGLSAETIKSQRSIILIKLESATMIEAVAKAFRSGVLK